MALPNQTSFSARSANVNERRADAQATVRCELTQEALQLPNDEIVPVVPSAELQTITIGFQQPEHLLIG